MIKTGDVFTVSKTDHRFIEVIFAYPNKYIWKGCYPIYYPPMSINFDGTNLEQLLQDAYNQMQPEQLQNKISEAKLKWGAKNKTETYAVFDSLLSGKWECRSCGAGKINDQPAARIRDIKKNGFVIATKTRFCPECKKQQYHDLLLLINIESQKRSEFRRPISPGIKSKIIKLLCNVDAFSNSSRQKIEYVIDHKFPSQRWEEPETDNEILSDEELVLKFQLLTNQSNMLKSRCCDECCRTGIRPDFLGIKWFYAGNEKWVASDEYGSGCYGCPWFDLKQWKTELSDSLCKLKK